MARPTTVRLYPLPAEHTLPFLVDFVVWFVAAGVFFSLGVSNEWLAFLPAVAIAGLAHVAQMAMVALEFDDTAITIVRPWRRRRVEWTRIAGLIYTTHGERQVLRLVLKGNEPPQERYLTEAELRPYAKGPVVVAMHGLADGRRPDTRSAVCRNRIRDELARHGFPLPPDRPWVYRSPAYTDEQATRAATIDLLGLRPVTVTHGPLTDAAAAHTDLVDTVLPDLALDHGAQSEIFRDDTYTTFLFDGRDAEQHAAAFRAAAQKIVPDKWAVEPSALPPAQPDPGP
jgi:hypothetical protein